MTALEEDPYAIEQAPRRQPMLYPGRWPEESVLLAGQSMWPVRSYDSVALGAHDPVDWDGFRYGVLRRGATCSCRCSLA